jgi:hypothetical protein
MKPTTYMFVAILTTAIAFLGVVNPADASSITYVESGIASGTIGTTTFTNALVTVTLIGDTSGVAPAPNPPFAGFLVNLGSSTVNIAGVGTATVTDTVGVYSGLCIFVQCTGSFNGMPLVLIATLDNPQGTSFTGIMGTLSNSVLGYNLKTSIGPISGVGSLGGPADPFAIHHTTLGVLNFTADPTTSTFTATVASVPEPSSILLLGTGVIFLIATGFRRRPANLRGRHR